MNENKKPKYEENNPNVNNFYFAYKNNTINHVSIINYLTYSYILTQLLQNLENQTFLKEFEDSFKARNPTKFIRGGFIGINPNSNFSQDFKSNQQFVDYEKGQIYEMNPGHLDFPIQQQFGNNLQQINFFSNNDQEKRNLKGNNLIRNIITDNEISYSNTTDSEKNSNLYLCKLK